jgi:hypothetical protein
MRSLVVACGAVFFVLVSIYLSGKKHARELAKMGTPPSVKTTKVVSIKRKIIEPAPTVENTAEVLTENTTEATTATAIATTATTELDTEVKKEVDQHLKIVNPVVTEQVEINQNERTSASVLPSKELNLKKIYGKSLEDKTEIKWDVQLRQYQASLNKMLLNSNSDLNEVEFLQGEILRLKEKLGQVTSNTERWKPAFLMYFIHEEKYKPNEINKAKNYEYFGYTKADWEKLKKQQIGKVQKTAKRWKGAGPKGKWVEEENADEVSDEFAANDYKVYKIED